VYPFRVVILIIICDTTVIIHNKREKLYKNEQ
jgi:hypothetical protein